MITENKRMDVAEGVNFSTSLILAARGITTYWGKHLKEMQGGGNE